jgi:hypothetical protein
MKTCATQLYIGGVLEAEIVSITSHRSQQGVRKYMKSNVDMKKNMCKILEPPIFTGNVLITNVGIPRVQKRPLSPPDANNSDEDSKRVCPEIHIPWDLAVIHNCPFSFAFAHGS